MNALGQDHKLIEVQFFEGNKTAPFAKSKLPLVQLPDTFEVDTTLNLAGEDWRVLAAEPPRKSEFGKIGKLKLYLAKDEVISVDPEELLYSLPTLNNDRPAVEYAESLQHAVVFSEDGWRQVEFISQAYEASIAEELEAIHRIYENHSVGSGFTELHLRQKITEPLSDKPLTLSSLYTFFAIEQAFSGVAFNTAAATIVGGFALYTRSAWLLWGQADAADNITSLNLSQTEASEIHGFAEEVDAFTIKNDLYLVDWSHLFWCGPGKLDFADYRN
ncbi:MAG: hypothetical protein ACU836_16715 [Gammaproteobacteria bacterium]